MVQAIDPVGANMRLTQLLGQDDLLLAQVDFPMADPPSAGTPSVSGGKIGTNAFEDMLSKAIESLNEVSRTEIYANRLAADYARGEADLKDVMVAQAKASIMVQLAVTTVNAVVNTFKEVTQMQV